MGVISDESKSTVTDTTQMIIETNFRDSRYEAEWANQLWGIEEAVKAQDDSLNGEKIVGTYTPK